MPLDPVDKAGLLSAIAAAGSQGAKDYTAAQSALGTHKTDAIRQALSSSIAKAAPPGAGDVLSGIISQPYDTRNTQLASDAGTNASYYGSLGAASGTYATEQNKLPPMIETQYQTELARARAEWEAERARQAANRGSGGGGGGGGDWYDMLGQRFGGKPFVPEGIMSEVKALGYNSKTTGLPRYLAAQQYAAEQYGVPGYAAEQWFKPSKFGQDVMASAAKVTNSRQLAILKKALEKGQTSTSGDQSYWINQALFAAKANIKKKKK